MKVREKRAASFASLVSASNVSRFTMSTLFRTSARSWLSGNAASFSQIVRSSSVKPLFASIRRATTSASAAPPHAVVTIARSSRRFGRKMPGVSTKTICASLLLWMTMPRTSARVVCTLCVTIESFEPTTALRKRGFARIRRADQRDEPGAGRARFSLTPSTRPRAAGGRPPPRARLRAWSRPSRAPAARRRPRPRSRIPAGGRGRYAASRRRMGALKPRRCAHSCSSVFASRSGPRIDLMRAPQ